MCKANSITYLVQFLLAVCSSVVSAGWMSSTVGLRGGYPLDFFAADSYDNLRLWTRMEGTAVFMYSDGSPVLFSCGYVQPLQEYSISYDPAMPYRFVWCNQESGGIYFDDRVSYKVSNPRRVPGETGVCYSPSMGVDAYNRRHIIYKKSSGILTYAGYLNKPWEKTEWIIKPVDLEPGAGRINTFKLDQSARSHIVYYSEKERELKYACINHGNIQTETVIQNVDLRTIPSLGLDENGAPHVSYYSLNKGLFYAVKSSDTWEVTSVDSGTGAGYYSSLAVSSNGAVHIAYADPICGNIKYAVRSRGDWQVAWIAPTDGKCPYNYPGFKYADDGRSIRGMVGVDSITRRIPLRQRKYGVILTLDSGATPHVLYNDEISDQLKYATINRPDTLSYNKYSQALCREDGGNGVDVTSPKSSLEFYGRENSDSSVGAHYVSSSTLIKVRADDVDGPGGTSGPLSVYYKTDGAVIPCVERAYNLRHNIPFKDGERYQEICGGEENGSFELPEGVHTLNYLAADGSENYEVEQSTKFYVDGTPPVSGIKTKHQKMKNGEMWLKSKYPIKISANDPISNNIASGVSGIYYAIDPPDFDAGPSEELFHSNADVDGGVFKLYSDLTGIILPCGKYELVYFAVDKVGNRELYHRVIVNSY